MPSRDKVHGPLALGAAWLAVTAIGGLWLYFGLVVWVHTWRDHPDVAEGATVAVCGLALVGAMALVHGSGTLPDRDDREDEDDGGGEPRPSPPPVPRDPAGPAADWDGFDRFRADWERVPARH